MIEVSDEYYYEEEEDLNNNEEIEEEPDEGEVEEISSDNYHITEDKIVKRVDNKTVTTSVAGYVAGGCDSCGVDESDKEDITKVSQLEMIWAISLILIMSILTIIIHLEIRK